MIYPTEFTNPLDDPYYGKTSREEEFYYRFRDEIKTPGIVFYNLILKLPGVNHREIDFLYICPSGIFVIELKNVEFRNKENAWEYYNSIKKQWENYKIRLNYSNPIEQLKTGSQEIVNFLNIIHKANLPITIESIYSILFLLKNQEGSLSDHKDKSINIFYRDKCSLNLNQLLRSKTNPLTEDLLHSIEKIILNNTNYYTTFERRMEEHSKKIIALTKQQYLILDDLETPNILLSGVAGSGKTLIALEGCRIAKKKNWSTLLICRSSNLNKYLDLICKTDNLQNVEVKTMSSFCNMINNIAVGEGLEIEKPKQDENEDFLREAQPKFINTILSKIKNIPKYDFLIVDEAQDVMSFTELSILDQVLIGGYEKGKWLVCYDEEQALYGEVKEGLEFLESYSPKKHNLSVNKRTPRSIYELACKLSGKYKMESDLDDPSSIHVHNYKTIEEGKEKLLAIVDNAVSGMGFKVEDIIILSPTIKSNTEIIGNIKNITNNKIKYKINVVKEGIFKEDHLGFSEIGKFKGMERKFVILTGIDDFSNPDIKNTIYVALTRATHHCTILLNNEGFKSYKKIL
jgi:DNA polymerase III delta prime subunit